MMKPKEVLHRLEQAIGIAGAPRRLREAIESELLHHFGVPAIQAAEQAEKLEDTIRQLIVRTRIKSEESGTYSVLSLSTTSEQFVVGSCFVESGDTPDVTAAKRRRLHIEPLLDQIRALNFRQFEVFGACVLRVGRQNSKGHAPFG